MTISLPDWPILMQHYFGFFSLCWWFTVVDCFVGWIGCGCLIGLSSCFRYRWRSGSASRNRYGRQWVLPFSVPSSYRSRILRLRLPVEPSFRCGIWRFTRRSSWGPPRRHSATPILLSQMSQRPLGLNRQKTTSLFFEIWNSSSASAPILITIFISSHSVLFYFLLKWHT